MSFQSDVLSLEVANNIAILHLDRPEARNAMGKALWEGLTAVAEEINSRDDIRVVVLAARGPHFTVGLDLKEVGASLGQGLGGRGGSQAVSNARTYQAIRDLQNSVTAIAHIRVPVIAAVHGYCIGGGVDLICACDIRLASSDTIFSIREAKIAIVADLGTLQRLPHIVGAGHVAELAYTGKDFTTDRAERIGLINEAVEGGADGVLAAALTMAGEIAANPPLAVQGTKAVLAANDGRTVEEGLDYVAWWNTAFLQTNDLTEAMTAFMERRPGNFSGS
ncbi:MAG: crotonase/enoyl-CoA hydratase family protein [Actinomycetota bacterium]|jgi:enoyl-CoA hydratase